MRYLTDFYATIRRGDCSYQFSDRIVTDDFEARLITDNEKVRLEIAPRACESCEGFDTLAIAAKVKIKDTDRVFLNGYQSWTDSREYRCDEKMTGIDHIPKVFVNKYRLDRYGDYRFTDYTGKAGEFHGWSYGYVRSGADFSVFGSMNETDGFTLIRVNCKAGEVSFEKETANTPLTGRKTALEVAVTYGSENEAFDSFFALADIKCRDVKPLAGYTSWYRHYQNISEDKLLHDLEGINKEDGMDIFQIDDGYQTAVGDWLSVDKEKFPRGMKFICDKIHKKGLKAGIWLAPFVVEKNSLVFRRRNDMLLCDENGDPVPAGCNWTGSYALDLNNDDVRRYLTRVFDTVLGKWGFDLVKLDFLYAACIQPKAGQTRGEAMYEGMKFLRELCGDKLILGCGVPLASAFGVVDYCRIGCDVGLSWNDNMLMQLTHRERVSTKNSMLNTIFRRQLNGRAFLNDPDVFILRDDGNKLTNIQKQALAIVNDLFGSVYFTSDDMLAYNDKQKRVLDFARTLRTCVCESADYTDGKVTFTYRRNGKLITAELSANGNIHALK